MMTSRRAPLVLARGLTAAPIHVPDHLKQLDYLTLAMPTGRCMIVGRPLFKYPIAVVPPPEEVAPLLSAIRSCECRPFRIISFADEMGKVSTRCLPRLTQWRAAPVIAAPSHPTRLVPHCPPAAPPHSTTTNSILMCCHRSSTAPSSAARRMRTPGSTGSLITHSPVAARCTSARRVPQYLAPSRPVSYVLTPFDKRHTPAASISSMNAWPTPPPMLTHYPVLRLCSLGAAHRQWAAPP